jgi:mxaJ protein
LHFKRIAFCSLLLWVSHATWAADPLRVCAAENELPYSDKEGRGFENKLAELLAKELGRTVENVWWHDPRYFVRDSLDKGDCDVVIGVDTDDPRFLTSEPYYRSGYAFVVRKADAGKVRDWDSPWLKTVQRIAFMPDTPADTMVRKIGRHSDLFNYIQSLVGFKAKRNQYVRFDPEKLVQEVASGNAEVAVLWAPQAARYVKQASQPLEMVLIPDQQTRSDGEKVPHHYSTSIGVRKGGEELMAAIGRALHKQRSAVQSLLKAEGIPLLPLTTHTAARPQKGG